MSSSRSNQRRVILHRSCAGSYLCLLVILFVLGDATRGRGQDYPSTNYPEYTPPGQPSQPAQPGPSGYGQYQAPTQPSQPVTPQVASLPQEQVMRPQPIGLRRFEPTEIMAMVGDQPILACDIMPDIDRHFEKIVAELRQQGQYETRVLEVARAREEALRTLLEQAVQRKLAYVYFMRSVPAEALPQLEERIYEGFFQKHVPQLLTRFEVETTTELDALLRENGSSLAQQRRMFKEQVVAMEAMRASSTAERMINHEEMLAYYHAHLDEFSFEAQVRWEQIMVRFASYPTKADAFRAMANMGNEVLRGAPLEVVARRSSEGPHKEQGGQYDWTTQGSLAWLTVDEALFTLPEGSLSTILEDESSFHIVRVIERRDAGHTSFREAQGEIQEKILQEYQDEKVAEFLESLRDSTEVWTIFDDLPDHSGETLATGPSADPR